MRHHRLKSLRVRRDRVGGNSGNDQARVCQLRGGPSIPTHNTQDPRARFSRHVNRGNQIGADAMLPVSTAHREDEHTIAFAEPAAAEPVRVAGIPPIVVDPRRQLGRIVRGRVAFDSGNLAEVAGGMSRVSRASAHAQEKESAPLLANIHQQIDHAVDHAAVESRSNIANLFEIAASVVAGAQGFSPVQRELLRNAGCVGGRE